MASSRRGRNVPVYQLKVTLKSIKPPIWRRFLVPGNITLDELHLVLQAIMGWDNYHLYSFKIGGAEFGEPDNAFPELEFRDSAKARLNRLVSVPGTKFLYEYDFGDSWEHNIVVEKILPPQPGVQYPVCLGGRRSCPPEDCGGTWGYAHLLEIISNPGHEEYSGIMEWLGGRFDPEAFDLQQINGSLSAPG